MPTRAIKRKRDEEPLGQREWQAPAERAPSVIRQEQATPTRLIAVIALFIGAVGGLAVIMAAIGRSYVISPGLGLFLLMLGLAGLLLHAFNEKELVYRRTYGLFAAVLAAAGVILSLATVHGSIGGLFLPVGAPCFLLALCFGVSFARNEADPFLRALAVRIIGVIGAVMIVVGVVGGILNEDFLMSRGVVYLLLALVYVGAYVGTQSVSSTQGYWAGVALGVVGVLMIVVALGRALPWYNLPYLGPYLGWINDVFGFVHWLSGQPGAPFLFTYLGLEYLALSIGICSDAQWVVLTRRELASYFYSPIAYFVMVSLAFLGGLAFFFYVQRLIFISSAPGVPGIQEPVIQDYLFSFLPIVCLILMVPIITMRLFSEERRSGTLEVLMTAPVREGTVVIAKFLAGLRFFLLAWYPWGLYLIALRVEGGEPFDYRPVLTFAIALAVCGAGFVAMGEFFSSLTGNQIISAILTLIGMFALLFITILQWIVQRQSEFWSGVFRYMSFYDLLEQASTGQFAPRFLFFHISLAVFFLFLTAKVLESRKWR